MNILQKAKTIKRAVGLLTAFLLSSCVSTVWYKDGLTETEFNRDAYECQRDVYAASGPRYRSVDAAPKPNSHPLSNLGDELNRMGFEQGIFEQCMRARGYRAQR